MVCMPNRLKGSLYHRPVRLLYYIQNNSNSLQTHRQYKFGMKLTGSLQAIRNAYLG